MKYRAARLYAKMKTTSSNLLCGKLNEVERILNGYCPYYNCILVLDLNKIILGLLLIIKGKLLRFTLIACVRSS